MFFDASKIEEVIDRKLAEFPELDREHKHKDIIINKVNRYVEKHPTSHFREVYKVAELEALDRVNMGYPNWTFVASALLSEVIRLEKNEIMGREWDATYLDTLMHAYKLELLDPVIFTKYTMNELKKIGDHLVQGRDSLLTYDGLSLLKSRYLIRNKDKQVIELPQERFMTIALILMQDEAGDRMDKVLEAYWAMSNLYMTVATPTLSNAGKSHGQLSSCFIDTVNDALRDIYDSNTDSADLSKSGGGIGLYFGKVRSKGSDIKGFKNVSSGVIPWIKQINNTAVSVDQLGQRQGAMAVYLDVWHKDIRSFLKLRTNNGDSRMKAHDIFPGVCLPDIFMEAVDERKDWFLFDPHEVKTKMGVNLEDYYDEKIGEGSFRNFYFDIVMNHPEISRTPVKAIDIMKEIMEVQLETGTPFMFYRDSVNRDNPNKDKGMIYSSNLCTEIMQNMSATQLLSLTMEDENGDDVIVTRRKPGEFVVCNLSSINLAKAYREDVLERLIKIQVRMLDNVIDINKLPLPQATRTNKRYRSIGLGAFGWHQVLAESGILWESEESVTFADKLYERIAYNVITTSNELAIEKGSYPLFKGSEWESGKYIERNYDGYESQNGYNWAELRAKVATDGIRNGYLMAVAPNSSTAIIAASTAGIDPIFDLEYNEEKKDMTIPVVAAGLNPKTFPYYQKTAFLIDQNWSIKQNAARQRHIDQAISFNLYLEFGIRAKTILDYHLNTWKSGIKTTYYTRLATTEQKVCENCAS